MDRPIRIVNCTAPIRVCDNGGWTDTWFARHGKIFNIAVTPYAEVQVKVYERDGRDRIMLHAENYGERYVIPEPCESYSKQPLLEATIDYMKIPPDVAIEATIHSEAPSGCSTGTSAAVSVALIGALDRLRPAWMTPHEIAMTAQRIETELLGQQCGVQDQLASAYGGINYIEMTEYPNARVTQLTPPEDRWWDLESRLSLIFVGQAHNSSDVHQMVIRELASEGPDSPRLQPLRRTAERSRDALCAGDWTALGRAMIDNTEAQGNLHAALIGADHARIIEIAAAHGAIGWKVNGAGGKGGSVTILSGSDRAAKRAMLRAIRAAEPKYQNIPLQLSRGGLRLWESA